MTMPHTAAEDRKRYCAAYQRDNRAVIAERHRNYRYRDKCGTTPAEVREQLAAQGGKCAICFSPLVFPARGTHVDHSHAEGHFRGVLCTLCNPLLGYAKESATILRRAAAYLEETCYGWN